MHHMMNPSWQSSSHQRQFYLTFLSDIWQWIFFDVYSVLMIKLAIWIMHISLNMIKTTLEIQLHRNWRIKWKKKYVFTSAIKKRIWKKIILYVKQVHVGGCTAPYGIHFYIFFWKIKISEHIFPFNCKKFLWNVLYRWWRWCSPWEWDSTYHRTLVIYL